MNLEIQKLIKFLFVILIFISCFLRFYQLKNNPPSLAWDEVAWGYNAYSLGKTGADEFGRKWPLDYLESFGDFKPPVYAYLTILPVKIFGLNEFATRFVSAFLGVLTVLLSYFLVKELFKNSLFTIHYSLFTIFLLAISPWHIMLSRAAFEANVASFLIVLGVFSFLRGINKNGLWLVLSAISFALSLQTFNTARIVSPLLVLILLFGFKKQLWQVKKWLTIAFLIGFLILLPAIPFYLTPQAKLRFKEVNIFSNPKIIEIANQEMENDNWVWWSRIIHNRRWKFAQEYLRHYFDHFNPNFLFIKGDGNPKFSLQDVGQLYWWELPFLIWGILILFRRKEGNWWLIPWGLVIGIIPAASARETPHALRIETTLPIWQILGAIGLGEFWEWCKKKKKLINYGLKISVGCLIISGLIYFQHNLYFHYPYEFSGEWQYGYKQAIEYIKEVENQYEEIWFTQGLGRPYIYFLFYLKKDPVWFQNNSEINRDVFGFVEVKQMGKYYFFRELPLFSERRKRLVIDMAKNIKGEEKIINKFYLLNGKEILVAYEI